MNTPTPDREIDCNKAARGSVILMMTGAELILIHNAVLDMFENEGKVEQFGCAKCVARLEPLVQRLQKSMVDLEQQIAQID